MLDEKDEAFISSMDRINFIALLCMRQFAEVIHIMTIEARDVVLEVQHRFSDHDYYLNLVSFCLRSGLGSPLLILKRAFKFPYVGPRNLY